MASKKLKLQAPVSLTPAAFAEELKTRGLVPNRGHFGYDLFDKNFAGVIRDAKAPELTYVVVPFPPVGKDRIFTEETVRKMALKFDEWGAACKSEGLRFGYHPNGLEFRPSSAAGGETMFGVLVRETKPDLVTYQMDVYWVYITGRDPAGLLAKYPDRWSLLHIKDMLKDFPRPDHSGGSPATAKVAFGTGQINWSEVLATAQKIGVKHYFMEDDTTAPLRSIPESLQYFRQLKL